MRVRTYSELLRYGSFEDRFDYLLLGGVVGERTFDFDRWINQEFYRSQEWRNIRRDVAVRDNGCDLGIPGFEVHSGLLVHHMNPLTVNDIVENAEWILNPEFLISTSQNTHNAIHYGNRDTLRQPYTERVSGDTKLW